MTHEPCVSCTHHAASTTQARVYLLPLFLLSYLYCSSLPLYTLLLSRSLLSSFSMHPFIVPPLTSSHLPLTSTHTYPRRANLFDSLWMGCHTHLSSYASIQVSPLSPLPSPYSLLSLFVSFCFLLFSMQRSY